MKLKRFTLYNRNLRRLFGKIKQSTKESYLITQKDTKSHYKKEYFDELDIKVYKKLDYKRGLREDEKPLPISPIFGPLKVDSKNIYLYFRVYFHQ